jgi:hypothetical protein
VPRIDAARRKASFLKKRSKKLLQIARCAVPPKTDKSFGSFFQKGTTSS